MTRLPSRALLAAVSLTFASVALAGEPAPIAAPASPMDTPTPPVSSKPAKDDDANLATKLPNFLGLSGMRDMIDARTPQGFTLRGGVRLQQDKEDLHGALIDVKREELDMQAYMGLALAGFFEAGARLPFSVIHTAHGLRFDGHDHSGGKGIGDLDIAAKVTLPLTPELTLAPYVTAQLPTGDKRFSLKSGVDVGGALTMTALDEVVAFHVNVAGSWHEGGDTEIKFRVGPSLVPIATKVILLRPYVYLDGREVLHSDTGLDLRVAFGAQALLFDLLTVEIGADWRFMAQPVPEGIARDEGTWRVEVGAGVAF